MDSTILEINKASGMNTIRTLSDQSVDLEIDLDSQMIENKEAMRPKKRKEFKIKKSRVTERESKIIDRFYSQDSLEDTMLFESTVPFEKIVSPEKDSLTEQWNRVLRFSQANRLEEAFSAVLKTDDLYLLRLLALHQRESLGEQLSSAVLSQVVEQTRQIVESDFLGQVAESVSRVFERLL